MVSAVFVERILTMPVQDSAKHVVVDSTGANAVRGGIVSIAAIAARTMGDDQA